MADWKIVTIVHRTIFRWSGGRVGAKLGGIDMAVIDSVGRKTGKIRTVPIACYPYQGSVAVVASNNGGDSDPAWLLNLRAHPEVDIQLGQQRYQVKAEELSNEEMEKLWPKIIRINPRQSIYRKQSRRKLPVVYFRRL